MHLHRVPGIAPAEEADAEPPEAVRADRPGDRPFDCGPVRIDDGRRPARRGGACFLRAVGQQAEILRPLGHDQVDRQQHEQGHQPERPAGAPPAILQDDRLQPRQDQDRADADAGKGDPGRKRAAAHEPVGQILRLHRKAHAVRARAHQHAERRIELPRRLHHRGAQQPRRRQHDADLDHETRSAPVHDTADHRADHRGHQEAEGKGAGREAAIPAELVDDGREHQREGRAGGDAHRHRQEGDHDDHPAEEERQARRKRRYGRRLWGHRYFLYPFRQPRCGPEGRSQPVHSSVPGSTTWQVVGPVVGLRRGLNRHSGTAITGAVQLE